uniref:Centrosomal protein 95 n=1 Tax=Cyclopterus lumpus TaxID=8103 RepID=A0A8C3GCS5_CYCLU
MGTQEGERDWVDVANDLLSKFPIKLRLRKLTDCDTNVFIALYENILGEKVPDYITVPCSQEDNVHNVQSVIDSLSLDYLQISLSHITGENVVSGDKESISNLLEIFDGLLEYLKEEISEESQNGGRQIHFSFNNMTDNYVFLSLGGLEPLLYRRQRNKQAEEELHHISENLSYRLEELDQMLKRVLGESGESSEVREEDKQSHHSDSIMECGRTPRQHAGTTEGEPTHRTRSLSPSPPRVRRSLHGQLEDAMAEALSLDDGRQTNLAASDLSKRGELHHRPSHRKHSKVFPYLMTILLLSCSLSCAVKVKENELLPVLLEELPHLHISPHALGRMWEQQMQQVDRLHALTSPHSQRRSKLSSQVEEAQRKHDLLVEIIRKDKDHNRRLRDFKERIQQQKSTQNRLREQRQQMARAKKYHSDYHVQHRARLMRARTQEEKVFRQLFEEGLELQKVQLREQKAYAKEQRLEHQRRHQDQIKSMENYYKDQFSLLAEKLSQERQDIQVRKKAQEKALLKMKRELRSRMEREIGELQEIIIQNDEDDHFQDLEVQALRSRVQMASFQHNTSYLH